MESTKRDTVFASTAARGGDFEFNEQVAKVFDDMLVRSVPFYLEQQCLIKELAGKFWVEGTQVYDLGCSTATTLINIAREIAPSARLVGYDNSAAMLQQAQDKCAAEGLGDRIELRQGDLNAAPADLRLDNAGVVTVCWTLQFVRPARRERLMRWIYESLAENGIMLVTEKVLTNSTCMNRFFIDLYYDYKRRNGYSDGEIQRKREALENVLVPYRLDENLELFRASGFEVVETFFQWYNFVGFLCMKKAGSKASSSHP
jgi:tRNA (cmo5U34)-methyltransferase